MCGHEICLAMPITSLIRSSMTHLNCHKFKPSWIRFSLRFIIDSLSFLNTQPVDFQSHLFPKVNERHRGLIILNYYS